MHRSSFTTSRADAAVIGGGFYGCMLAAHLRAAGGRVVEVPAYETRCPESWPSGALLALERRELAAITFSSAKTVEHTALLLQRNLGADWRQRLAETRLISIGPQTSRRCRDLLGRVDAEADPHDLDGMLQACIRCLGDGPLRGG